MNSLKTILVSQPEPASDKSPYNRLQNIFKLKIDFRPFIHVEGVDHTIFLDKQAQNLMISNFSIGFHAAINKTTL